LISCMCLFLLHSYWGFASFSGKEGGPRALQAGPSESAVKGYANREVVVLASHGRSGSTVAESLFFRSVEGFVYFDEPLWPFKNATGTPVEKTDNIMAMLFDCEAYETMAKSDIPPKVASDWFLIRMFVEGLPSWLHLPNDLKSARPEEILKSARPAEILGAFDSACRHAPIVGTKVIRMETAMKYALDRYENLRIIHLIRHPHEVHESQNKIKHLLQWSWYPGLHELCAETKTNHDAIMGDGDANQYEGRYLVVRYQDLVTDTLNVILKVHNFMGVKSDRNALEKLVNENFVTNDEVAERENRKAFGTKRSRRECGACSSAVEAAIDAEPTCRHLVDEIGLQCCN